MDDLLKEWGDAMGGRTIDLSKVPDYMHKALALWVVRGVMPGSFLTEVLCNNLRGAAARADEQNARCLFEWVEVLHNQAPIGCWGSDDAFNDWRDLGGLRGLK